MGNAESQPADAQEGVKTLPSALVIVGPSGVGKGTLIEKLMADGAGKFGFSCSHTTRQPRPGEVNGQHYHFTTHEAFEKDIEEGKFLEHAHVHSNIYGTSIQAVKDVAEAGKCCILDIDVQGARQVRKADLRAIFVFIAPPSLEELERRLRGRATDSEEQITTRLRNAREEMTSVDEPGLYDYVLVNNGLEECYEQLKQVAGRALAGEVGPAPSDREQADSKPAGGQQVAAQQGGAAPAPTFKGWLPGTSAGAGTAGGPALGLERWRGKVALITGAGGGVGAALAASLAAAGLRVVAVSRRKAALEALQGELGAAGAPLADCFLPVVADITREAEVVALPRIVAKRWPGAGVDVLINNAAAAPANAGLLDGATSAWVEMVSTNVLGAAMAAREAVRDMRARAVPGHIINIGCALDNAGQQPSSSSSGNASSSDGGASSHFYGATKAALAALTAGLRAEARVAGLPLRVSLVSPGSPVADGTEAQPPQGQLAASDVVHAVRWVLSAPDHVDVSELVVRSVPQQ